MLEHRENLSSCVDVILVSPRCVVLVKTSPTHSVQPKRQPVQQSSERVANYSRLNIDLSNDEAETLLPYYHHKRFIVKQGGYTFRRIDKKATTWDPPGAVR